MRKSFLLRAAGFVVAAGCVTPVQGAYISASLHNSAAFGSCGTYDGGSFGGCQGGPNIRPVSVLDGQLNGGIASALTDYGTNKVEASSGAGGQATAVSEWQVPFTLTGAPIGTPVTLLMTIGYDVSVNASAIVGLESAEFRLVVNGGVLFPYIIRTTTSAFAADQCFDRPAPQFAGACAGNHNGTIVHAIQAYAGLNGLTLFAQASTFGTATVDAFNTVTIQSIIVPNGISWSHNGLEGNPLNFQYAPDESGVPEPGSVALAGLGLIAVGLIMRRSAR